jgi:protein-export membrane protein SecD
MTPPPTHSALAKRACSFSAGLAIALASLIFAPGCAPPTPEHGTAFVVAVDTSGLRDAREREQAVTTAGAVLRRRLDKLGVRRARVQPSGADRILIQVGAMDPAATAALRRLLERSARLELRLVHEKSEELVKAGTVPPGYVVMKEDRRLPDGSQIPRQYVVRDQPERGLTGKFIKRASATRHQFTNEPEINFEFNPEGTKLFGEVTEANVDRQLAIVLDGVIYSAPIIKTAILGGSGVISGNFDVREASELASLLADPLQTPLKIVEEKSF